MNFIAVIPARHASTRLPGKPLLDLAGEPMVVRVAHQAAKSQASRVIVATDFLAIKEAAKVAGFESLMTGAHHASGTDRLAEVVEKLNLSDDVIVVNVQGDEPLIDPELINGVAAVLNQSPQLQMATAAHPIDDMHDLMNPNVVKVVLNQRQEALYFSRAPIPWARDAFSKGLPETLPSTLPVLRHIGLYAYRAGFLKHYGLLDPSPLESIEALEQLRVLWHGYAIGVMVTQHAPQAGVDTAADLERVRNVLASSHSYSK